MAQDIKYDGESGDSNENEDYFSCDSGIGALKFRKRLEQLQSQDKRLESLQFQLLTIKNANYITELDTICAVSIIQAQNKSNSKLMKKASNYKVVFNLFTENETQRAFNAVINADFRKVCYSYWKDTFEANNNSLTLSYQLVETTYTLFRKSLNNKAFIFLMVGNHESDMITSYRLLDILQSMIVDLCTSLQIKCTKTTKNKNKNKTKDRKMSLTAMIEILEEVFGGNGDDIYPLNKTEFVTCMRVRIGMESVWEDATKQRLQELFDKIISASNDADIDIICEHNVSNKCLRFDNFITYFSPFLRQNNFSDDDEMDDYDRKIRFEDWKDIKHAVYKSPLSKRNKILREKENISAGKYREKLNDIEKLINLLEECLIFAESKRIKKKDKNVKDTSKRIENEQLFWRKKILQHREFVRFYQDVILNETIKENNKMKLKIDKLVKLNKFSKKVQYEENEWYRKNKHLLQIEQQYYSVLKKQRNQQNAMKECEKLIQEKDNQIYQLKSQLNKVSKQNMRNNNNNDNDRSSSSSSKNVLNHKISKLKGEIAQKKLQIQNQLNLLTANINHENDRDSLSFNNKREKIRHDRI